MINKFSALHTFSKNKQKTVKYNKIYFSLICKTPIKIKKLNANIGAHIDKIKGIRSV